MPTERPQPEFVLYRHNDMALYTVTNRDLMVRTGINTDGRYIGTEELRESKDIFDELRRDYHLPVIRSRMELDNWIHPGSGEYILFVPKMSPFTGEFTSEGKDRFVAQARGICDNLTKYYADRVESGKTMPIDIRADQFIFGSMKSRNPQLWLPDIDTTAASPRSDIVSEPLAEVGVMALYFEWLTGEDFEEQLQHVLDFQGIRDEMENVAKYIEGSSDESEFMNMPTAYLREKLIVGMFS